MNHKLRQQTRLSSCGDNDRTFIFEPVVKTSPFREVQRFMILIDAGSFNDGSRKKRNTCSFGLSAEPDLVANFQFFAPPSVRYEGAVLITENGNEWLILKIYKIADVAFDVREISRLITYPFSVSLSSAIERNPQLSSLMKRAINFLLFSVSLMPHFTHNPSTRVSTKERWSVL